MKVLITGSRGFAARHLAVELLQAGHEVIKSDVEYAEDCYYCDLRDEDSLRKLVRSTQPDACVHLGGIAYVPMGWKDPELVYSVNLMGTLNLLEGFRHERPEARLLVVSSSLIYKNADSDKELDEEAYMYPPDIYAISKISADLTALGYAQRYGMPIMTARPINHTGPGQSDSFVTSAFATQLKQIKAGAVPPVMRVGNLDSRRDFLDVRDVVRAYRLLIEAGQGGEPYNIASGRLIPIRSVLEKLCDIAGVHPEIEVAPQLYRPTDSSPRMNVSKIRAATGWQPQIPLEQTLLDLYQSINLQN
jgi:GDP-4-dehydro-6-deoxy-D-mannose reductase